MILDTNAISALAENNPGLLSLLASESKHHLPVPVLGEYRFGLKRSRYREQIESWLDELEEEFIVLITDPDTARHYATIREQLRRDGKPIPQMDIWIAALALQYNQPIISRDAHFDLVDGVRRQSW